MKNVNPRKYAALTAESIESLRHKITSTLLSDFADIIEGMSKDDVYEFVCECEARARTIGVESDRAVFEFVCLTLAIGDEFEKSPDFIEFVGDYDGTVDDAIEYMSDNFSARTDE